MKARARKVLVDADRDSWVPDHAVGQASLWTPAMVKAALLDAYRILGRVGGRYGPAGMRVMWPEFHNAPGDWPADEPKLHRTATRREMARMETVVLGWRDDDGRDHASWLAGPLLSVPEYRDKLEAWLHAELRGENLEDMCLRRNWVRSTFVRHVTRAAGMIADRLNRARLEPW